MRYLIYPFLAYRSVIVPFLAVSAIAVPVWLVFRLYRLRTSRQRTSIYREVLYLILVCYLSGVAAATLSLERGSPSRFANTDGIKLRPDPAALACVSPSLPSGANARSFCGYNAKGNVLLFFPLGILLPLLWRRLRFRRGLLIALGASITIELLQYVSRAWGSHRLADIDDVILNVVGACLGMALVYLIRRARGTAHAETRPPSASTTHGNASRHAGRDTPAASPWRGTK